jgi:hypothetical protein
MAQAQIAADNAGLAALAAAQAAQQRAAAQAQLDIQRQFANQQQSHLWQPPPSNIGTTVPPQR